MAAGKASSQSMKRRWLPGPPGVTTTFSGTSGARLRRWPVRAPRKHAGKRRQAPVPPKRNGHQRRGFPIAARRQTRERGELFRANEIKRETWGGHVFGWFSQKGAGRYVFPYLLLRLLAGEVLENLQELPTFKD